MASEPFNIKKVDAGNGIDILYFDDPLPDYDIRDYMQDEDEILIKDIEKLSRNSIEYHEWVAYLRNYMDMNKCSFFKNISNIDTFSIKIHLHHSPITLMEIAVTVLSKRRFYRECMDIEAIAKEIMYLHYCLVFGIIPLCETVHELVHNQYLFVPNQKVLGNYKYFLEMYKPWIPPQVASKLNRIEEWSHIYDEVENTNVIKTNLVFLEMEENGVGYNLPKMEDIATRVQGKIEELVANNFQTAPIQLVVRNPMIGNNIIKSI